MEGLTRRRACGPRGDAARGTQGQLEGLTPKRRGRKPDPDAALKRRNEQLERENERLRKKLETAETILEVQGNVSRLLGLTMPKSESDS